MNAEWKEKWLEALRSGKYPQTKHRLKTSEGYCCLGVLCEIVKPVLGLDWVITEDEYGDTVSYRMGQWGERSGLPDEVRALVGLEDSLVEVGVIKFEGLKHQTLAHLNDAGADFEFIANVIEEQL